jgi:hypothetical protein
MVEAMMGFKGNAEALLAAHIPVFRNPKGSGAIYRPEFRWVDPTHAYYYMGGNDDHINLWSLTWSESGKSLRHHLEAIRVSKSLDGMTSLIACDTIYDKDLGVDELWKWNFTFKMPTQPVRSDQFLMNFLQPYISNGKIAW